MDQKTFDLVASQVSTALQEKGFAPYKGEQPEDGRQMICVDDEAAYGVFYSNAKKQFTLRACSSVDGVPDDKWKTISTWLFDPETDSAAQEQEIAEDFLGTIRGPKRGSSTMRPQKKHRKDDDANVDSLFFFNRFVGVFPELKDELNTERDTYGRLRAMTFAREKLLPKLEQLCSENTDHDSVNRCATLFNELYMNGDLDVRSLVTIELLNRLSGKAVENLAPMFDDNMKKGYTAGLRMKGKKVKPEKQTKMKKMMAATLNDTGSR